MDDKLRAVINLIFDTHLDTMIDCDTCARQFACLAELVAQGANPAELLPAVEEHIRCCRDCREEFEFLVAMLKPEVEADNAAQTE